MADKKISALTASTTPLAGTEVLPIVQSGATVKVSVANLTAARAVTALSATTTGGLKNISSGSDSESPTQGLFFTDAANKNVIVQLGASGGLSSFVYEAGGAGWRRVAGLLTNGNSVVDVGNVVIGTAGKGIDFSANTHAAGMTSELLNDYEEGTWTPSVGGTATYFAQTGKYTKVGRLVTFTGTIYLNAIGTGSTTTISGLPFAAADRSAICFGEIGGLATLVTSLYGLINSGATTIGVRGITVAASANSSITAFQNQTYLDFSGQYTV